jgi:hypothetical protein
MAQSVQQRATAWKDEVRFRAGTRDFSLLHSVQTASEVYPASYPKATGALSPKLKKPGRESDHSPPSNVEVNNGGALPPFPYTSYWRGAEQIYLFTIRRYLIRVTPRSSNIFFF